MKQDRTENGDDAPDVSGHRGRVRSRYFEKDALVAFIDLLGTRKLYENTPVKDQVERVLDGLLRRFDEAFSGSNRFRGREIQENFDVGIFADSI